MTENTSSSANWPGRPPGAPERAPRRLRADAQRNIGSLLAAAKAVFRNSGVDAPAKEIERWVRSGLYVSRDKRLMN